MTIKEITVLRRSGHLPEALAAAEAEYSKNANLYTAGALFWCLNDLYKTQDGEAVEQTVGRMQALYHTHCEGDEFMARSLSKAESRILPHSARVKEALENAKNGGDAIALHRSILTLYEHGEIAQQLFDDFGWLTYYAIKATPTSDAYRRKVLLNLYFKLELERPSILHSLILGEAIKLEHDSPLQFRIRDFIRMWGLENLREEDWEEYKTDTGNLLPSTVEKLIGVYAKELLTDRVEAPYEFSQLVDKALDRYPKSQNMPYFKANVLISQGRRDEAVKYYKDLILRYPTKFYLWEKVSELVDDTDTEIGLLSKALNCGNDEEYIGGVRLRMASLLIRKGLHENAKTELEKYRSTYQSKGWNLKSEFRELYNQVAAAETIAGNSALYSEYSGYAETFIYSDLPEQIVVKISDKQVEDRNRPGRKFLQWTLRAEKGVLRLKKPTKFGLKPHTPNGALFTVKTLDDKIVWIRPSDSIPSASWIKVVIGSVKLRKDKTGRPYAIVQGVYVGEKLLKDIVEGCSLKVLAIKQDDGRWSAISTIR